MRDFFAAFGRGDLEGLVRLFHPDAELVAVRDAPRGEGELHGSYRGEAGVRTFVAGLALSFETQAFEVDGVLGDGDVAFASGRFVHRVRSTGRLFRSEWALRCVARDGLIRSYRFYEDSAAFQRASREGREPSPSPGSSPSP